MNRHHTVKRHHILICIVLSMVALITASCGDALDEQATTVSAPETSTSRSSAVVPTEQTIATTIPVTVRPTTTVLPSPEETILGEMALREKAAQVLLLTFAGTTVTPATEQLLAEGPPGGLLVLGPNVSGAEQLTALTAALQTAAVAAGAKVGLFIAVDQEGGTVQRVRDGVPRLPAARTLGEGSSILEVGRLATETAEGLLKQGVNMNLAPVADVVSDPASFLYSRSYGGDPTLVADYVKVVTEAHVDAGLIAVAKHFPGHGSALGNTHGEAVVSEASQSEFATLHIPPFKAAIASGVEGVMMAHVIAAAYDPDLPASLSSKVVGDLLREGLGFTGLVVSDDLEMAGAAVTGSPEGPLPDHTNGSAGLIGELAVLALSAGCDLLISTGTLERQLAVIDAIEEAVKGGRLSEARLDEAVSQVLRLKLCHHIIVPAPLSRVP